jgi:hypothetical protein
MWISLNGASMAHQMTPTYPKLKPSAFEQILYSELSLFNRRDDVEYYEIGVYDKDWNEVSFASQRKILQMKYLETRKFDVYIRQADRNKVMYICTESKLTRNNNSAALVESRICSKVK